MGHDGLSVCTCVCVCVMQVLVGGRMDAFMLLAMLWAAVNTIPPLLFIVYFFTKGWLLRWSCFLGQALGLLLGAGTHNQVGLMPPFYLTQSFSGSTQSYARISLFCLKKA